MVADKISRPSWHEMVTPADLACDGDE